MGWLFLFEAFFQVRKSRLVIVFAMLGLLSSCGLFDSGVEWRGGPYALMWLDTSENISICRELDNGGCIGRIESTVFAVGWDGRFLVAKQHPNNDRSLTYYFIIDSKNDGPLLDSAKVVTGPISELEFQRKSIELKLPKFTKVLTSLQ